MDGEQADVDFFDDEDIDLQDGDVTRSLVDGLISIEFFDRVQSLAEKSFNQTLVVKLLGRRIGYTTLRTKIYELWKPKQAIRLMDIDNKYFLIRLPGLSVTLYQRSIIEEIGASIGPVAKLDYQTESGRRGRFTRMAIYVDLSKPLISKLIVNGRIPLVEYESLPVICFHCGRYGHVQEGCPDLRNTQAPCATEPDQPVPASTLSDMATSYVSFRPWMVVARRTRKPLPAQPAAQAPPAKVVLVKHLALVHSSLLIRMASMLVNLYQLGDPTDPPEKLDDATRDIQPVVSRPIDSVVANS
ncbi:hypothetical protein V6N11_006762 [Hibiscus sabdariffa]|uniref:CCHC-type domain-containing protein n=1 Tax=Hibiscus sabdariffa TaxID=183260 RepID=A0ABR2RS62_9ROSI